MRQFSFNDSIVLKIRSAGLTEQQKKLIKSINNQLVNIINADKEDDFFNCTEEVVKNLAALVKLSHFSTFVKSEDEIPYAEQALEFSFDIVQENLYGPTEE